METSLVSAVTRVANPLSEMSSVGAGAGMWAELEELDEELEELDDELEEDR